MFAERLIEPELLDHAEPEVARQNLADLVRINSRFGGHSTIKRLLRSVVHKGESFTLLDVGAASGDTGRLVSRLYPRASVTNLDYNCVNLHSASTPKILANAFELPLRSESFDFVFSSLFLHHFPDRQVEALLREMLRVARRSILAVDLERHILPYIFLPASRPLFDWGEITVHDGLRSVRAAFTCDELASLARRAGVQVPQVAVCRPAFRLTLRGDKKPG